MHANDPYAWMFGMTHVRLMDAYSACTHACHILCLVCVRLCPRRQYAEVLLAMGRTEQALSLFSKTLMLRKTTLGTRHLTVYESQVRATSTQAQIPISHACMSLGSVHDTSYACMHVLGWLHGGALHACMTVGASQACLGER